MCYISGHEEGMKHVLKTEETQPLVSNLRIQLNKGAVIAENFVHRREVHQHCN